MRKLLTILLLFISYSLSATNYYVKTGGNDEANGTSDATAWATISKVNTVWTAGTFAAGDSILFNRGDTFYGTITVKESGASGNHIILGAYGSGADPIIYGYTQLTSWVAYNDSVDYALIACESATNNMVTINGVNTAMGRYPDSGTWLTYESASTNVSITDNQLSGSPNWTGAELVLRKANWTLERSPITDHTNTVITYTTFSTISGSAGFGYFIQKDIRTLNNLGEWYYDGDTLFVYFGANNPASYNVKITNLDYLVTSGGFDYITLDNISFDGASLETVSLAIHTNNWTIKNCTFNHAGKNAVDGHQYTHNIKVIGNTIKNTNNNAYRSIYLGYNNIVRSNTIDSTGVLIGMVYSDDDGADAIVLKDDNILPNIDSVVYNRITNTGHSGIRVQNSNYAIVNNYIDVFGLTKNDVGGIYTWKCDTVLIKGNVVVNGYGESGGCISEPDFAPPDPYTVGCIGIYLDERTTVVNIENNVVANNRDVGILVQMSSYTTVTGNTCYNNGYQQIALVQRWYTDVYPVRNTVMNNNIFFARLAGRALFPYMQYCLLAMTYEDHDVDEFGIFDNNYYARPIDQDDVIRTFEHSPFNPWTGTGLTIAQWQTYSGQDANSSASLVAVTDTLDIHFIYNDSTVAKSYTLSAPMKDVANADYSGTINLEPFTSRILLGAGTVTESEAPPDPEDPDPPAVTGGFKKSGNKFIKHNGKFIK